ncbi:MAG: hypothetical protein K2M17_00235, partial [Bacilli bacterium]|nr:hypothetical protein [Bacilli bacterium]
VNVIFLLSGCGWNDVVKEYGTLLSLNPTCTYSGNDTKSTLTSLSFSASTSGIKVNYNNGNSSYYIVDPSGKVTMQHEGVNGKTIDYNGFQAKSFFKKFVINSDNTYVCPDTIYICSNVKEKYVYIEDYPVCTGYSTYTYEKGNTSSNKNKNCTLTNATSCKRTTQTDIKNRTVYLELGREQRNGSEEKYLLVSYDNYKTYEVARNANAKGLSVHTPTTKDNYVISDSALYDLDTNGQYGNSFYIKFNSVGGDSYTYYISKNKANSSAGNFVLGVDKDPFGDPFESMIEDKDKDKNNNTTQTSPDTSTKPSSNSGTDIKEGDIDPTSFCVDTAPIWRFAGYIFMLIKIIIPLIIIVLGIVDLFKVITSGDDKAMNKAMASVVQRVVMGIAIFFVPTVVSLIFSIIKESAPFLESADACQVCLLRPTSSGKDSCENYVDLSKSSRQGVR